MKNKHVVNPYLPNYEYIPDAEPYVFGDRVYIYGSHDRFGAMQFCLNDYVTWSAPVDDLSDWRYEGVIFKKEDDPLNKEPMCALYAPDMQLGPDGRYYLYYAPVGLTSIGVAVADTPVGPFTFHGHVQYEDGCILGRREGDAIVFDPGTFVDDDQKVYMYYGFEPWYDSRLGLIKGPYVTELAADMHTIIGGPSKVEIQNTPCWGHEFFEASSMRKINGIYYFIYSSKNSHELCYATGNNPMGPFTYGGVLHSNGDIGYQGLDEKDRVSYTGNNHGSLVQIKGQWYIFGHRMTNYTSFSRQAVAEPVTILEDGSIPQAELTSCGLNGGPLMAEGSYDASIACALRAETGALHYVGPSDGELGVELRSNHPVFTQDGGDREDNPGQYIANMKDGATAGYKYFNIEENTSISVVTRGEEGVLEIRNTDRGEVLSVLKLTAGTEWHSSQTVALNLAGEKKALYFTYKGKGSIEFLSFKFV